MRTTPWRLVCRARLLRAFRKGTAVARSLRMKTQGQNQTEKKSEVRGLREAYEGTSWAPESKPEPPFPAKKLEGTGEESQLEPRPRYQAPRYKAAGKLAGKAALITGGDSGIGRAVAVLYARE